MGIVGQTIQFHGPADLYTLNGASSIATLYSNASTATTFPAVTLVNAGAGQAAAFTYDLARSIVYTRQGNPAWSGQARDGQAGPIRSDDLYFGAASFDPQPDWVDLNKVCHSAGRRATAPVGQPDPADERGQEAAAALLVFPQRLQGGRGDDRRRSRIVLQRQRHQPAVQRFSGCKSSGMFGGRLAVRAWHVVSVSHRRWPATR